MVTFTALGALVIAACTPAGVAQKLPAVSNDAAHSGYVLRGVTTMDGDTIDIAVSGATIVAKAGDDFAEFDATGLFVTPAFIDSHVHLSLYPVHGQLFRAGIAAAVDLASPEPALARRDGDLAIARSGPMITSTSGYPTQSWGRDGYGMECDTARCGAEVTERLANQGAKLVKVAMGASGIRPAALLGVVQAAKKSGLPVAAHALTRAAFLAAARSDVQVLAHTPVEPLSASDAREWGQRHVISTLSAFGGSETAVANLRRLREAGAIVLYGTDLGNTRQAAIQGDELALMQASGMSPQEILESASARPAELWGFAELGDLSPGKSANFLLFSLDPRLSPESLSDPIAVFHAGVRVR